MSATELTWTENPPPASSSERQTEERRVVTSSSAAPAAVDPDLSPLAEAPALVAVSEVQPVEPAPNEPTADPVGESAAALAGSERHPETTPFQDEGPGDEAVVVAQDAVPQEPPVAEESQVQAAAQEPEVRVGDLVTPGPGVVAPRPIRPPSPRYPPGPQRLGREASVTIRVLVDETGRAAEVQRVGPEVGLGFDEAALEAARAATWEPATKDGVRVKMWVQLAIRFEP